MQPDFNAAQLKHLCSIAALTLGWVTGRPCLALSSRSFLTMFCFKNLRRSWLIRCMLEQKRSCDIMLVPMPPWGRGDQPEQEKSVIFHRNWLKLAVVCIKIIFVKLCWNIKNYHWGQHPQVGEEYGAISPDLNCHNCDWMAWDVSINREIHTSRRQSLLRYQTDRLWYHYPNLIFVWPR